MQLDFFIIRVVFSAMLVGAGLMLSPIEGRPMASAALSAVLAAAIIFFETRVRQATLKTLIGQEGRRDLNCETGHDRRASSARRSSASSSRPSRPSPPTSAPS